MKQYNKVAVGGTFDHLHLGHRHLLSTAYKSAQKVVIGITKDEMVTNKKLSYLIEPYELRRKNLEIFVKQSGWIDRTNIVELTDIYGTTLTDIAIEALVVTQQTKAGAFKVSQKRKEMGMSKLPVMVADLIHDDGGVYISSTRIRAGEINALGRVYSKVLSGDYTLNANQRAIVAEPLGKLINYNMHHKVSIINTQSIMPKPLLNKTRSRFRDKLKERASFDSNQYRVFLVGDIVTNKFIELNLKFDYAVIDNKSGRKPISIDLKSYGHWPLLTCDNQAGKISLSAVESLLAMIKHKKALLEVNGEEDLLVIPLVLMLPLGSLVYYGQPNKGMVEIVVDTKIKDKLYDLLVSRSIAVKNQHRY